ncbi:MAG: PEP-CTERM sorting domain-containing protein [Novosphingobium sp.]|nr:PEP-CTERM sorting domain-containing protein [Novosphingobium sp.]
MARLLLLALVPLYLLQAAPAAASWSNPVPEPSDLALFALGMLGVIVGRHGFQQNRKDKDGDE